MIYPLHQGCLFHVLPSGPWHGPPDSHATLATHFRYIYNTFQDAQMQHRTGFGFTDTVKLVKRSSCEDFTFNAPKPKPTPLCRQPSNHLQWTDYRFYGNSSNMLLSSTNMSKSLTLTFENKIHSQNDNIHRRSSVMASPARRSRCQAFPFPRQPPV